MKQKPKKKKPVSGLFLLLVLVFSSLSISNAQAQDLVTGIVLDETGQPLPGVNIVQQNTRNGVITDFDGKYSITLQSGEKVLVFTYIGYKKQEVLVQGNVANVTLEDDVESLDQVVVVGFRPVKREKLTGSVTGVESEEIEKSTPVEAFDAVQGRVSGVQIISNNGPGQGFEINIRGVSSFGDQQPLFVVDGQQVDDIDNIDPSDIETLDILKDGASTAKYGARGGNGVVLVTTKSGKAGSTKIRLSTQTGVNTVISNIDLLNGRDAILLRREIVGDNPNARENADIFGTLLTDSNDLFGLITRPSLRQNTNIAISGGTEKSTFYWNTGFLTEKGIVIGTDYKRINTQLRNNINNVDCYL